MILVPARYLIFTLLLLATWFVRAETPVLRLATWNLEHLAEKDGAGCRPRTDADYARLRQHAARLDANLIALQEVQSAAAVARVFDPARYAIEVSHQPDRGLGPCHRRRGREGTMQRTGFAIDRAQLNALGLTYERLPDFVSLGMQSQRWATRILIKPHDGVGKAVELLSLHLKSGCAFSALAADRGRWLGAGAKREQCRLLVQQRGILEEWIDARASADRRFILLGDFNRQLDQPDDSFWSAIDDGRVCSWIPDLRLGRRCRPGSTRPDRNADLVLANAGRPFPFPYNPRYPYAIDHIVFDRIMAQRIIPESYLALDYADDARVPSDHHPVAISLRWTRRP